MGTVALTDLLRMSDSGDYSDWDFDLGEDNASQILMNDRTNRMQMEIANLNNLNNLKIAQNTNELNKQIAEDKNALDYKIFQETNQYNTPEAQKQRYLAAGLNPIAAMSSGSIGPGNAANYQTAQATAIPGAPMVAPQLNSPHLANSTRGVDIAAALTNIANAGKGFADTAVSLRGVKNAELGQMSQSKLNYAKALQSLQETDNLKQVHDVLTPANVQNVFSQIKQREHQNSNLDSQSEMYKSNIALNDAKRDEIKQAIVESNARIDNMRKTLGWQYYNTNVTTGRTWAGIFSQIAQRSGLMTDVTEAVSTLKNTVKNAGDPKKQVSAACDFVSALGDKALESGSEKFTAAYATFKNALPVFIQNWMTRWEKADVRYRKEVLDHMNSSNTSVLNPSNSDSFE